MASPFFPPTVLAHPPLKINVMPIECEAGATMQVEGLRYAVLVDSEKIEKYVVSTCGEEWDNEDFETFLSQEIALENNLVSLVFQLCLSIMLYGKEQIPVI